MRHGFWRRWAGTTLVFGLAAGLTVPAHAAVGGATNSTQTQTTSTTRHTTTTSQTNRVDVYDTTVLGYVYSDGALGFHRVDLVNVHSTLSPNTVEIQTLVANTENAVAAALTGDVLPGRCASLSQNTDITQNATTDTQLTDTQTAQQVSISTDLSIGPGTILIGEDQSQTFFVAQGTTNLNTNTHTETFVHNTYTATTTNVTSYEVVGHKYVSPLILDLSGKGQIQASGGQYLPHRNQFNMTRRALFDFYGNGFPVAMEWVGPQDGLLVMPKADGSIDGTCLFGTATGYETGFEQLASLDNNLDLKISGSELAGLMVWQDKNGNARGDQGEMTPVQDLGISELSLRNNKMVGSYKMKGQTYKMFDWWPTVMELKKVAPKPAV